MKRWNKTIKIKYLFTESEEYDDLQRSMNAIADVLEPHVEQLCVWIDEVSE